MELSGGLATALFKTAGTPLLDYHSPSFDRFDIVKLDSKRRNTKSSAKRKFEHISMERGEISSSRRKTSPSDKSSPTRDTPSGDEVPKKKRTIASGPKTRNGCVTCKKRHIKCDEQKPECRRCINFGVRCGGYHHLANIPGGVRSVNTSPTPSHLFRLFPVADPRELRSLEYYHHKIAARLNGYYHKNFWSERLLTICVEEPAVRMALVAFSSLYEINLHQQDGIVDSPDDQNFAVALHNRAIRELMPTLQAPGNFRIPLTVCLLFACIDSMRGEFDSALGHVRGGLQLLNGWRERYRVAAASHTTSVHYKDYDFIENTLTPIFGWLGLLMCYYGMAVVPTRETLETPREPTPQNSPPLPDVGNARTLDDWSINLTLLVSQGVEFAQKCGIIDAAKAIDPTLIQIQHDICHSLDVWKAGFVAVMQQVDPTTAVAELSYRAFYLMSAAQIAVKLWIQGYMYFNESQWDAARPEFEECICMIEKCMLDGTRWVDEHSKFFSFEVCFTPILQFIISKCRWPALRRRALRMLRACPRIECIFDSNTLLTIYERVTELEEAGIPDLTGRDPLDHELPPEASRIHLIKVAPIPATQRGRTVNFYSKTAPDSVSYTVRAEYLNLNISPLVGWVSGKTGYRYT